MTQFVITIDTTIKRIGIGYTGDGPQTDVSDIELSEISLAYFTNDWERLSKTCRNAIYHSRDKPYFDPSSRYRRRATVLILYSFIVVAIGFVCGISYVVGTLP